jgi:hypothetical protein
MISYYPAFSQSETDYWIEELDKTIPKKEYYRNKKWQHIDSLKSLIQTDNKQDLNLRYTTYEKMFEEYKSFIYDSAFTYARELLNTAYLLKDRSKINVAKIKISFPLLSAGLFKEALDTLNSIDPLTLTQEDKIEYYSVKARTYLDLSDYVNDKYYDNIYDGLGIPCLHEAQKLCSPVSKQYLMLKGWEYIIVCNIPEATHILQQLLQNYNLSEHEYAIVTSSLSYMYRLSGQLNSAKEFLAKAAIADIKSAVCETVATTELAEMLRKEGDIERAHRYVKLSLDDAYFYGAKYRKVQIANTLPLIEATQLAIVDGQRKTLLSYAIAITILSFLVIGFAIVTYRQYHKINKAGLLLNESHNIVVEINNRLYEANKIKEEYIGNFYTMISEYVDKLENMKVVIDRKISQKKYNEIKDVIGEINSKNDREQLYENFDTVFLKIFPRFTEEFNTLFKPEDQFTFDKNKPMSLELRIFALIRLGINENEKIALILQISVNTIYTYKTRVKNKSILPNDQFEARLLQIKAL